MAASIAAHATDNLELVWREPDIAHHSANKAAWPQSAQRAQDKSSGVTAWRDGALRTLVTGGAAAWPQYGALRV
jgi:hypothetical protein